MVVVAFDLTLFETGLALRVFRVESVRHEKARASISVTTPSLKVGLGEFIFYSMIPPGVIASFGLRLGLVAAGSIMIGALANGRILSRREMISGLGSPLLPSLFLLGLLLILSQLLGLKCGERFLFPSLTTDEKDTVNGAT